MIVGWQLASHMRTQLVVDALEMAAGLRQPPGELVAHTDAGSLGGFNRSSQHLEKEVVSDGCQQASEGDLGNARPYVVTRSPVEGGTRGPSPVLGGDRPWSTE
jgi:transposase InsO family protein